MQVKTNTSKVQTKPHNLSIQNNQQHQYRQIQTHQPTNKQIKQHQTTIKSNVKPTKST